MRRLARDFVTRDFVINDLRIANYFAGRAPIA
jgi:hypothetical protein